MPIYGFKILYIFYLRNSSVSVCVDHRNSLPIDDVIPPCIKIANGYPAGETKLLWVDALASLANWTLNTSANCS